MNLWHRVNPASITPENFLACIEIPQGTTVLFQKP